MGPPAAPPDSATAAFQPQVADPAPGFTDPNSGQFVANPAYAASRQFSHRFMPISIDITGINRDLIACRKCRILPDGSGLEYRR